MIVQKYSIMATPLITGNRNAQKFLSTGFYKRHAFSPFFWEQRMTKSEAHAAAWAAMRRRMEQEQLAQAQKTIRRY